MADGTVDGPTLRAALIPPPPFHHTIAVVLDSCYTEDLLALPWVLQGSVGPALQQAKRPRNTPFALDLPDDSGGSIVCLSAASVSEKAYEARGGAGLLTSTLVRAAGRGGDHTWGSLLQAIKTQIPKDTPHVPTPVLTASSKSGFSSRPPFVRGRRRVAWWCWWWPALGWCG